MAGFVGGVRTKVCSYPLTDWLFSLDAGADIATIDCHGPIRSHELCRQVGTVVVYQIS